MREIPRHIEAKYSLTNPNLISFLKVIETDVWEITIGINETRMCFRYHLTNYPTMKLIFQNAFNSNKPLHGSRSNNLVYARDAYKYMHDQPTYSIFDPFIIDFLDLYTRTYTNLFWIAQ